MHTHTHTHTHTHAHTQDEHKRKGTKQDEREGKKAKTVTVPDSLLQDLKTEEALGRGKHDRPREVVSEEGLPMVVVGGLQRHSSSSSHSPRVASSSSPGASCASVGPCEEEAPMLSSAPHTHTPRANSQQTQFGEEGAVGSVVEKERSHNLDSAAATRKKALPEATDSGMAERQEGSAAEAVESSDIAIALALESALDVEEGEVGEEMDHTIVIVSERIGASTAPSMDAAIFAAFTGHAEGGCFEHVLDHLTVQSANFRRDVDGTTPLMAGRNSQKSSLS